MLAEHPGLDEHVVALQRIGVRQRENDAIRRNPLNESRHVFWEPGATAVRIKVAHAGVQQAAVSRGRDRHMVSKPVTFISRSRMP